MGDIFCYVTSFSQALDTGNAELSALQASCVHCIDNLIKDIHRDAVLSSRSVAQHAVGCQVNRVRVINSSAFRVKKTQIRVMSIIQKINFSGPRGSSLSIVCKLPP